MATEVRLRDGSRAVIWGLLPSDREGLRLAYEQLSPETQRHRFLTPVPRLTEEMLHHLVDEVDGVDHVALVLFVLDEQHLGEPAGVARMIRYRDDPTAADVAVTVIDEHQGRGVASALLTELLQQRPQGVVRIVTEVSADNPASLAMLRRLGPTTVTRQGPNLLGVTVELPRPDEAPPAEAAVDEPPRDERPPDDPLPGSSPS
ncbi:MAG TPA: GNAT family N-acetyltransferase [Nocardioidaceae bacterium]